MVLPIPRGTKVRPMGEDKSPGIPKTFALQSTQPRKKPKSNKTWAFISYSTSLIKAASSFSSAKTIWAASSSVIFRASASIPKKIQALGWNKLRSISSPNLGFDPLSLLLSDLLFDSPLNLGRGLDENETNRILWHKKPLRTMYHKQRKGARK